MSEMFMNCSSLKNIDLSSFETSKCENFDKMFEQCNKDLVVFVDDEKAPNMIEAIKNYVNVTII